MVVFSPTFVHVDHKELVSGTKASKYYLLLRCEVKYNKVQAQVNWARVRGGKDTYFPLTTTLLRFPRKQPGQNIPAFYQVLKFHSRDRGERLVSQGRKGSEHKIVH